VPAGFAAADLANQRQTTRTFRICLLKPGVTCQRATADLVGNYDWMSGRPRTGNVPDRSAAIHPPLIKTICPISMAPVWRLLWCCALGLLIACSKVANMRLARGSIRAKDLQSVRPLARSFSHRSQLLTERLCSLCRRPRIALAYFLCVRSSQQVLRVCHDDSAPSTELRLAFAVWASLVHYCIRSVPAIRAAKTICRHTARRRRACSLGVCAITCAHTRRCGDRARILLLVSAGLRSRTAIFLGGCDIRGLRIPRRSERARNAVSGCYNDPTRSIACIRIRMADALAYSREYPQDSHRRCPSRTGGNSTESSRGSDRSAPENIIDARCASVTPDYLRAIACSRARAAQMRRADALGSTARCDDQ